MGERKYYVLCGQNCKFESMTKEQILAAIAHAVETGEVKPVDTGFIETIKTINGKSLRFFVGEQAEYESLSDFEKSNVFALITNDTTKEALFQAHEELNQTVEELVAQDSKRARVYDFTIAGDRKDVGGDFYHYCYEHPVGTLLTFKNHSEKEMSVTNLWAPLYYYIHADEADVMHFYGDDTLREMHIKLLGEWACLGRCGEGIYLAQRIR